MTDEELRRLFESLREENAAGHAETRRYVDESVRQSAEETRTYVDGSVRQSAEETRNYVDESVRQSAEETRKYVDEKTSETRRHFEVIAEGLDHKFALLAEGVVAQGEELRGKIETLEAKVDRGFADTQAMIRFSHAELDRRVKSLEESVSDLQARVERLESTIH